MCSRSPILFNRHGTGLHLFDDHNLDFQIDDLHDTILSKIKNQKTKSKIKNRKTKVETKINKESPSRSNMNTVMTSSYIEYSERDIKKICADAICKHFDIENITGDELDKHFFDAKKSQKYNTVWFCHLSYSSPLSRLCPMSHRRNTEEKQSRKKLRVTI